MRQTTPLEAVIIAQQKCQFAIDTVTLALEIMGDLDLVLEQLYRTPNITDAMQTALNDSIDELKEIEDVDLDLSHLESLLDTLRLATEKAALK